MKRAQDLKAGDWFYHSSSMKIPNPMEVGLVMVHTRTVSVYGATPYNDYRFSFPKEQKIETKTPSSPSPVKA